MLIKFYYLSLTQILLFFLGAALSVSPTRSFAQTDPPPQPTATVYTDKEDYQPGDIVIIEGDGWTVGEQVKLAIQQSTIAQGITELYATADENGHIYNNEFVIQPGHLGESFTLTATGQTSGLMAESWFTDATKAWRGIGSSSPVSGATADFNTANNWNPAGVPGPGDDVTISISGGTTVSLSGNVSVNSLNLTNRSTSGTNLTATFSIDGYTLTVSTNLTLRGNNFIFVPTYIANLSIGTGTVTVSGNIVQSAAPTSITFTGPGNLNIGGDFSSSVSFYLPAGGGSTVNYNGTVPQQVRSTDYNNLTISGSGNKWLAGSVLNTTAVYGNFTLNSGDFYMITGGGDRTLNIGNNLEMHGGNFYMKPGNNFTGSAYLTVSDDFIQDGGYFYQRGYNVGNSVMNVLGSFMHYAGNFIMSNAGGIGRLNVAEDFLNAGGTITQSDGGSGEVHFIGNPLSAPQVFTSGGTITGVVNFTVDAPVAPSFIPVTLQMKEAATAITGSGSFTLSSGATLGIRSADGITSSGATGNIQVTGTRYYSPDAKYLYNGTIAQVTGNGLPAPSSIINTLTIDNSAGVTLTNDVNVTTLNLVNGILDGTSNSKLTYITAPLLIGADVNRANGWVHGSLKKNIPLSLISLTRSFEVGTSSGYNPVSVTFASVSDGGTLTAKANDGDHAAVGNSSWTLNTTKTVNVNWSVESNSLAFSTYNITFFFNNPADLDAGVNTSSLRVARQDDGTWTYPTVGSVASTSTEATGLTIFSDFQLAEACTTPSQPGAFTTGPTAVCPGQTGVVYTVPAVDNATSYSWEYSGTGATITNNGNSASIDFSLTATNGILSVKGVNECGVGGAPGTLSITINTLPSPTFTSPTITSVCSNTEVTYTTQSGMSNYIWAVPGTAGQDYSIVSGGIGATDNTVTLKWLTPGSKEVTVNYTSLCTGSTPATHTLTVNGQPAFSAIDPNTTALKAQYSDPVKSLITFTDDGAGTDLTASVQWKPTSASGWTSGLPPYTTLTLKSTTAHSSTWFLDSKTGLAPGAYTIRITVSDGTCSTDKDLSLTVSQEKANVTVTSPDYIALPSSSATSVNITLSATVVDDNDGYRGNITHATVTFRRDNPKTGTVLGTANRPVSLVDPNDTTVGVASTTFTYTLSKAEQDAGGASIMVYAVTGNYYNGYNTDPVEITIARPGADFVTGGGYLLNKASKGLLAGTTGLKTNFGFNMKYTKTGTNLKGQCTIIVRSNGHIYQIKSNAINTLVVSPTTKTGTPAYFNTKANYTDITDPENPVAGPGNLDLTVKMNDVSTGGQGDQVSILLQNTATSQLLFSSNWNGTQTVLQDLGGGNVQVRNSTTPAVTVAVDRDLQPSEYTGPLTMTAKPNPSMNQFTLVMQSGSDQPVNLRVLDVIGRVVEVRANIAANGALQIGQSYRPGVYYAELMQGTEKVVVRLLKGTE